MASIINVDKVRATGSTTDALTIDSSGRVLTPARPAFHAYSNTGSNAYFSANAEAVWNSTLVNVGDCYSTSTGRFISPIAGTYFFMATLLSSSGERLYFRMRKNGSDIAGTFVETDDPEAGLYQSASTSATITLAVNDYVSVYLTTTAYGGSYGNFNGHLVG